MGCQRTIDSNPGESPMVTQRRHLEEVTMPDELTSREATVLQHITEGLMNKQIAMELGISEQTVKNHTASILRKLGVDNRTKAAVIAVKGSYES